MKTYRVIHTIGKERETIYESAKFDGADWDADRAAYLEAKKKYNQFTMELWAAGVSVNGDGIAVSMEDSSSAGHIEIEIGEAE